MMKRLALLFAVLALVVAACSSDEGGDTTTTAAAAEEGEAAQETDAPSGAGTLKEVQDRGTLKCGVSGTSVGMSETDAEGNTTGFDADLCRATAAAVLGDSEAVEFRNLTAAERFEALKNNEVDVLFRNTTWTQSRDTELAMDFGPTTFFDGQQFMGDPAIFTELTPDSGFESIDGAVVCTNAGTTTEKNITQGAEDAGVTITLETMETFPEVMEKFVEGTCNVVTTDGSGLYGNRAAAQNAGTEGAENWIIFPTAPISKEPLGPAVRQNDSQWKDVIDWTVYALFIADENGVTSANVDANMDNTAELTRLFGGEGELQTAMGLSADAFLQVIKQMGNYGEIFERNLTGPIGLEREGSFNEQWFNGGLIYAPPAR